MTLSLKAFQEPELLTIRVADQLRAAILSGELDAGRKLSVPEIARLLGISRTPAREALLILERDGLVESHPRQGVVVLSGDQHDVRKLFELRESLDGLAARLAARNMSSEAREALRSNMEEHTKAVEARALEQHVKLDMEFHALIRDGSDNGYLADSLLRIERRLLVLMRMFSGQPRAMGPGVIRDHTSIANAISSGREDDAERTARRHVRNVWKFYQASFGALSPTGARADKPEKKESTG